MEFSDLCTLVLNLDGSLYAGIVLQIDFFVAILDFFVLLGLYITPIYEKPARWHLRFGLYLVDLLQQLSRALDVVSVLTISSC